MSLSKPSVKLMVMIGVAVLLLAAGGWALWVYFRTETVTASGLVQAKELQASSRLGGRVEAVLVEEGDNVNAGDVLIQFDPSEMQARLQQAQALVNQAQAKESIITSGADSAELQTAAEQVRQAEQALRLAQKSGTADIARLEAQLKAAQTQYEEAQKAAGTAPTMLAEGLISQQRYDQLMAAVQTAQSQLRAAEKALNDAGKANRTEQVAMAQSRLNAARAQYELLRKGARPGEVRAAQAGVSQAKSEVNAVESQLDETKITANIPGTVSVLAVDAGDLVLPGQPVATLINTQQLWADVYVPENRLYLVHVGDTVQVAASAFPKKVAFTGKVVQIGTKSEFVPGNDAAPNESVFKVKIRLNPEDTTGRARLYPGMHITATFERPALL